MHRISSNNRIAIIGCYPPPYGGVGMGVKRLADLLESLGIQFVVYNTLTDMEIPGKVISVYRHRALWSLLYLLKGKEKIIILRTSNLFAYLFGGLLYFLRKKQALIFVGNMVYPSLAKRRERTLRGIIMRWVIKHAYLIVGTSRQICQTLIDAGAEKSRVRNIAGFMLPKNAYKKVEFPDTVKSFFEQHKPVLLSMAFPFYNEEGKNIYGFDILLEAVSIIIKKYPKIGVLLLVPGEDTTLKDYWPELLKEIDARDLNQNVLPYLNTGEMYPFLQLSDIYIRPTRTDGDASSIREAIYMNVPVLASDCAPRPNGTITYPVEDIDKFVNRLDEMISDMSYYKKMVAQIEMDDNTETYIQLIKELLDNSD